MATQAIEQVDEAPPQNKGKRVILLLALGGILAGGAAGALALGPVIAKRIAARPAPAKTDAAKVDLAVTYDMANLVLNPAGTGGTRFLMVTATFQLKDDNTKDLFKARDSEVRDRILSVLGEKTIDDLSAMDQREGIKKEIVDSVGAMFPKGTILNLFLPQFVIQ